MVIDELKKANIQAMKDKDTVARAVYSILITKYNNFAIELKAKDKEITDTDLINIIQKTCKELDEEMLAWEKVGDEVRERETLYQRRLIEKYLPKQLDEKEIKNIIESLEDKSIASVMKHFKMNYAGQVDMTLVSRIAKEQ